MERDLGWTELGGRMEARKWYFLQTVECKMGYQLKWQKALHNLKLGRGSVDATGISMAAVRIQEGC